MINIAIANISLAWLFPFYNNADISRHAKNQRKIKM